MPGAQTSRRLRSNKNLEITTRSVETANTQSAWTVESPVKKSGYPIPCKRLKDTSVRIASNMHARADARGNYRRRPSITVLPGIATQFAETASTQHALHVGKKAPRYGHHTQRLQTRCTSALHARRTRLRENTHIHVKHVGKPICRDLTETRKGASTIVAAIVSIRCAPNVDKRALRYGHHTQRFQTRCIDALHARSATQK